jgi:nicotinamide-nucleotide amidase
MEDIQATIRKNLESDDIIVICGGLGPTTDDITRQAVAAVLNLDTAFSEDVCQGLRAYMEKKGKAPNEDYYQRQAEVIVGAEILENFVGLAPGLLCEEQGTFIFLLPGPPREFKPMVEKTLIPFIQKIQPAATKSLAFDLMGISETRVENALQEFLAQYPFISPAYCADLGHVKLTLSFPVKYIKLEQTFQKEIINIYTDFLVSSKDMMTDIAQLIAGKKYTLATAESCTGGGIGHAITAYAGASSFFVGSINAYANEWKINLLDVSQHTLNNHGAVSEECATEMINGLCQKHNVDCGIAVTGIAGPNGGTDDKPIGLIYIATRIKDTTQVKQYTFGGNRRDVREQTVRYALNQLRLQLKTSLKK